jgi:hypothetical protein
MKYPKRKKRPHLVCKIRPFAFQFSLVGASPQFFFFAVFDYKLIYSLSRHIIRKLLWSCGLNFAGITALFRGKRLKDDANRSGEKNTLRLFLTLAKSSEEYEIHVLQGYCLYRNLLYDTGNHS